MKTGVIILFHNYENELEPKVLIEQIQQLDTIPICLVNNESKDNTYDIVKDIRDHCPNVSVVNIKKLKSDLSAIRAGARYLLSARKLKTLGYINTNLIPVDFGLAHLFEDVISHREQLFKSRLSLLKPNNTNIRNQLFSIIDELHRLEAV